MPQRVGVSVGQTPAFIPYLFQIIVKSGFGYFSFHSIMWVKYILQKA